MAQSCYKILGVNENSKLSEVRSAYHRLALQYHPDRIGSTRGDAEKFKTISAAYGMLKKQIEKKRSFNRARIAQYRVQARVNGNFSSSERAKVKVNLNTRSTPHFSRTEIEALETNCEIHWNTATNGGKLVVKVNRYVQCIHQDEKGACALCKGSGRYLSWQILQVNVPAGIRHGQVLRFKGLGHQQADGRGGDLMIRVSVFAPRHAQENIFKSEDAVAQKTAAKKTGFFSWLKNNSRKSYEKAA